MTSRRGRRDVTTHHRHRAGPAVAAAAGAVDIGVLWGDLAVGVLVLAAGALMVAPAKSSGLGMDLRHRAVAIVVGSAAGSLLLALVGAAGHDRGVPTMTLLRPVLGRRGSYGASVINVGSWSAGRRSSSGPWRCWPAGSPRRCSASPATTSGWPSSPWAASPRPLGPIRYVRLWLERAGIWIVLVSCGFLTIYLLTRPGLGHLLVGRHGAPLPVGVDLVVAQPVSWLPLVADYNRFARRRRCQNFIGTWAGYGGQPVVLRPRRPAGHERPPERRLARRHRRLDPRPVRRCRRRRAAARVAAGRRDPRGLRRHLLGRGQRPELFPACRSGSPSSPSASSAPSSPPSSPSAATRRSSSCSARCSSPSSPSCSPTG